MQMSKITSGAAICKQVTVHAGTRKWGKTYFIFRNAENDKPCRGQWFANLDAVHKFCQSKGWHIVKTYI